MVVYVGDGWPTIGDASADRILARLARRTSGAPRLGAVAVGPFANRLGLAALVAARALSSRSPTPRTPPTWRSTLLAEALRPTLAGVELLLGSEVERVFPRGARAVLAGDTVAAVGSVRSTTSPDPSCSAGATGPASTRSGAR